MAFASGTLGHANDPFNMVEAQKTTNKSLRNWLTVCMKYEASIVMEAYKFQVYANQSCDVKDLVKGDHSPPLGYRGCQLCDAAFGTERVRVRNTSEDGSNIITACEICKATTVFKSYGKTFELDSEGSGIGIYAGKRPQAGGDVDKYWLNLNETLIPPHRRAFEFAPNRSPNMKVIYDLVKAVGAIEPDVGGKKMMTNSDEPPAFKETTRILGAMNLFEFIQDVCSSPKLSKEVLTANDAFIEMLPDFQKCFPAVAKSPTMMKRIVTQNESVQYQPEFIKLKDIYANNVYKNNMNRILQTLNPTDRELLNTKEDRLPFENMIRQAMTDPPKTETGRKQYPTLAARVVRKMMAAKEIVVVHNPDGRNLILSMVGLRQSSMITSPFIENLTEHQVVCGYWDGRTKFMDAEQQPQPRTNSKRRLNNKADDVPPKKMRTEDDADAASNSHSGDRRRKASKTKPVTVVVERLDCRILDQHLDQIKPSGSQAF